MKLHKSQSDFFRAAMAGKRLVHVELELYRRRKTVRDLRKLRSMKARKA